jgi:hypothetical protein
MKISVKVDAGGVIKSLGNTEKQVHAATMIALTKTAKHAQKAMYDEFRQQFDRPTPTVMKSLFVDPAKKDTLAARMYLKDRALGGKNTRSMSEILAHHFVGGGRQHKQLEDVLRSYGYLDAGDMIVPGAAAKMDRYGNMNRGQITQILSQIGLVRGGFDSSPTSSRRSKRNVARAGVIFWSGGPMSSRRKLVDKASGIAYGTTGTGATNLPKGAWMRAGRSVKPLWIVVKGTSYRRRFDFMRTGQAAVDRHFGNEFEAALRYVKATER